MMWTSPFPKKKKVILVTVVLFTTPNLYYNVKSKAELNIISYSRIFFCSILILHAITIELYNHLLSGVCAPIPLLCIVFYEWQVNVLPPYFSIYSMIDRCSSLVLRLFELVSNWSQRGKKGYVVSLLGRS
ncbi:hypothetical protein VNO77_04544 [Canavalia gladiata]|uniref:Uncharacterized protein n=1 Tax=Canavalia gladiata TaxID=3824 RepID=A0AAN9R7V8_CANGL